jgi:hemerythrin-like domain-containing protein
MEQHFHLEEDALFPALEQRAQQSSGPTRVMRLEHQDMRQLLKDLRDALSARNADRFLGLSETLLIMMQQHNYKEENVLYRMADYVLADDRPEILDRVRSGQ